MPLQIGGSGTGKPFCKFNAKADKWFVRGADGEEVEIQRPTFVIDLDNIATGWLLLPRRPGAGAGDGPEHRPAGAVAGRGLQARLRGDDLSARSSSAAPSSSAGTSIHLSNAIKDVYAQYEAEKANHRGELPVVSCTGSEAMKDRYGTNYRPTFKIVQWVERPKDLPNQSPVDAADVWSGASAAAHQPRPRHLPSTCRRRRRLPSLRCRADPLSEAVF